MTRWPRVVALGVCLAAAPALVSAQRPEGWDRYLDRYRGPYRGQVVDADTKAPLVGAVLVALWRRDRVYPFHLASENYAVREVVTDSEGRFLLEAKEIEEGAGRRLRHPEFLIFQPGYGPFPFRHKAPIGFLGGIFEGAGSTIELPRIEGQEDRRRSLRDIDPHSFSEEPFKELPVLMKKFNAERASVGFSPFPDLERR